jgi:hypothetical protein
MNGPSIVSTQAGVDRKHTFDLKQPSGSSASTNCRPTTQNPEAGERSREEKDRSCIRQVLDCANPLALWRTGGRAVEGMWQSP